MLDRQKKNLLQPEHLISVLLFFYLFQQTNMVAAKRSKFRLLNAACKPVCDMVAATVFYKKSVLEAPGGAAAGNM